MRNLAAISVLGLALTACPMSSTSYSPAPLAGGETITYEIASNSGLAYGTLTFEKKGSGFMIKADSPAFEPQRVGPDLMAGRSTIAAFSLGMVWLPPELRKIGSKTHLGNVTLEQKMLQRPVVLMVERNGAAKRYFHTETGFLVRVQRSDIAAGGYTASLKSSTIPGL